MATDILNALLSYIFRCTHGNVTWPQRGRQTCLECGRSRRASMTSKGWIFGKWADKLPSQTIQEVICTELQS
jgi:hypothetical protein